MRCSGLQAENEGTLLCVFDGQNVLMLEKELTYLGGMCSAALMRRDIPLPPGELPLYLLCSQTP